MRIQRWLLPYMLCAVASPQCPGSFSAQHVIASDSLKVQSIALGDINGDGLLDLAAASYGDNSIEWFPNEMTDIGTFGQKNIVTTGATGAQYVVVGDIDGDHFLDLISASYLATTPIAWSRVSASRTGMALTPKASATRATWTAWPGVNSPSRNSVHN